MILKASHLWDASRILVKFKNKYFINFVEEEEEEFIRLHKSYRIHNSGVTRASVSSLLLI